MGINNDQASAQYQSTDDSANPALIYAFPQKASGKFTVSIVAFDASQNTLSMELKFTGKRGTGNCHLVGVPTTTMSNSDLALAASTVSVDVFGGSFVINVTGLLATTINWDLTMQVLYDNSNAG